MTASPMFNKFEFRVRKMKTESGTLFWDTNVIADGVRSPQSMPLTGRNWQHRASKLDHIIS